MTIQLDPAGVNAVPAQWPLLSQALAYANICHADQADQAGKPYILHVLRVMAAVAAFSDPLDETTLAAALLHDVVENGHMTIDQLLDTFGVEVATLVGVLTRRTEQDTYAAYIQRILDAGDLRALRIKHADLMDNINRLHHLPDPDQRRSLRTRYLRAAQTIAHAIRGHPQS